MVQLFTGSSIVGKLNLGTHTGTDLSWMEVGQNF